MAFKVKFWGVRGSIACASPKHMVYGGNTSCIGVTVGDHQIILDAGTGIRNLGQELIQKEVMQAHILLTHTHWDHINGFPFFAPAYDPRRSFPVMAGHLTDKGGVREVMSTQMDNPMFPVPLEAMQANLTFEDFRAGESLQLHPGVMVRTAPLNHPNDATGYRIDYAGHSMCYITDTEHLPGKPDENILELIEGADLVIYDATYTEEEFPAKIGWGHSTWNEGMKLCRMANVKRHAIFHHEPDHDDDFMDGLSEIAKAAWEGNFVCKEGQEIELATDAEGAAAEKQAKRA